MTSTMTSWGSPEPIREYHDDLPVLPGVCSDPSCRHCTVAEAGGRVLAAMAGWAGEAWDALTPHERSHYCAIASEVMAAMSEAMIETGLAQPIGEES